MTLRDESRRPAGGSSPFLAAGIGSSIYPVHRGVTRLFPAGCPPIHRIAPSAAMGKDATYRRSAKPPRRGSFLLLDGGDEARPTVSPSPGTRRFIPAGANWAPSASSRACSICRIRSFTRRTSSRRSLVPGLHPDAPFDSPGTATNRPTMTSFKRLSSLPLSSCQEGGLNLPFRRMLNSNDLPGFPDRLGGVRSCTRVLLGRFDFLDLRGDTVGTPLP